MGISLKDLQKLESISVDGRCLLNPDEQLTAIFKVRKPDYVPANVVLRTRINPYLFTGSIVARHLQELEKDPEIESISPSKPLQLID